MNKTLLAFILCVSALPFSLTLPSTKLTATAAPNAKAFVGTWERFSFKYADGRTVEERNIKTHIIFSADGHYSHTKLPAGRDKISKPLKDLTKEELMNRLEGAVAMYGGYKVAGNQLTRTVMTSLDPNNEGRDLVQTFRFEGDVLILTPPTTEGTQYEARFRRVK